LLGPGAVGSAPGQTIVVTAKSVKDLAEDCEYLIKSAAPEGDPMVRLALDNLNKFKAGELIKGLDQNRGFSLAVSLPKDFPQGGPPSVVAAVPVSNFRQLLDSLKDVGLAADDQPGVPGFSHKVTAPDGNLTLFVLESKAHAFFSFVPDGADQIRALEPSSWRPKGRTEAVLSAKVQVAEIPDALKDTFLEQVARARQESDRKPGEKEGEFRARIAGQNLAYDAMKSVVREGDAIALDLDLNRKTSEVSIELSVAARPNTSMAKAIQVLNGRHSRFEGLGHGDGIELFVSVPMAKELRDAMAAGVEEGTINSVKTRFDEPSGKLYARFVEVMKSIQGAPELDYGIALQRSSRGVKRDARFLLVFGMKVPNGQEVERLIRDALALHPPEGGFKVAFDVAKAADGTAIHELTGPYKGEDKTEVEIVKRFGKGSLSFAFRKDAVLLAFGEESQAALRRAIEGLTTAPRRESRPAGPVELVVHAANLGKLAGDGQEVLRRVSDNVFRGDAAGHDRISFELKGDGNGLRLRLAIDLPVLKFAAMMGKETQK
jgi:hypothetical protein